MFSYEEICLMITCRLQQLLTTDEPYELRDEFIRASKRKGSDLYDSELEEMWLLKMAEIFEDSTLGSLIETRTEMYWVQHNSGGNQTLAA